MDGCLPPVTPTIAAKKGEKDVNRLGIGVGNRKCRAAIKDDKGRILDEYSSLMVIELGYAICFQECNHAENVL